MRKNKTIVLILLCVMIAVLGGCKKMDVGVTYNVKTGDKVTVYCEDKDLDFRPELPFSILDGKTTLVQGNFITIEQYNDYIESLSNAGDMVTIHQTETKKDNITYIFYETAGENGTEYNYIIKINNSNTGLVFGSVISKEAAEKAFSGTKFIIQK